MPDTDNAQTGAEHTIEEATEMAYNSVAQSAAIAIQDAVDNLRNVNAITAAVIGTALAMALEDPAMTDQLQVVVGFAKKMSEDATENFRTVGKSAADVLNSFPSGI